MNDIGQMVRQIWERLSQRFPAIEMDQFVVMPNHIHGIIVLTGDCRGESCIRPHSNDHKKGDHKDRPYGTLPGTLGRVVQAFKSITAKKHIDAVKQSGWSPFPNRLWQRNYYEHVIRDEAELGKIREYIFYNPMKWALDCENPDAKLTKVEEAGRCDQIHCIFSSRRNVLSLNIFTFNNRAYLQYMVVLARVYTVHLAVPPRGVVDGTIMPFTNLLAKSGIPAHLWAGATPWRGPALAGLRTPGLG